jgi:hypothetical protein
MRTIISFSGREALVAHLPWKQCLLHHVLVLWLKAIKFNISGVKKYKMIF